jgi:hypothetical protein
MPKEFMGMPDVVLGIADNRPMSKSTTPKPAISHVLGTVPDLVKKLLKADGNMVMFFQSLGKHSSIHPATDTYQYYIPNMMG